MKIKGKLYNNNQAVEITISDGNISNIKVLGEQESAGDLPIISPGFIDVQVNGYAGVSFTDEGLTVQGIKKATEVLQQIV